MTNLVWGNVDVNASLAKPEEETTKTDSQKPTTVHKVITQKSIITHENEKIALILFLTGGFTKWFTFRRVGHYDLYTYCSIQNLI